MRLELTEVQVIRVGEAIRSEVCRLKEVMRGCTQGEELVQARCLERLEVLRPVQEKLLRRRHRM